MWAMDYACDEMINTAAVEADLIACEDQKHHHL